MALEITRYHEIPGQATSGQLEAAALSVGVFYQPASTFPRCIRLVFPPSQVFDPLVFNSNMPPKELFLHCEGGGKLHASIHTSIRPYINISIRPYIHANTIHPPIHPLYPYIHKSIHPFYPSTHPSIYPSI